MAEKYAFLEIFSCCAGLENLCGGLKDASLTGVVIDRENRTLKADAFFARMPAPAELRMLEQCLCEEYGLREAEIVPDYPRTEPAAQKKQDAEREQRKLRKQRA